MRTSRYPLCRHTKTNGRLCQAPAVAPSAFCFFHRKLRLARRSSGTPAPPSVYLNYPDVPGPNFIPQTLNAILNAIARKQITANHAGKLLYALQQSAAQLHKTPTESRIYP
jgi:hypothetical protein